MICSKEKHALETFCPVTGLPIRSKAEWTDIDLGEGYTVTFKFIGDRILHSFSQGNAGEYGMKHLLRKRMEILDEVLGPNTPFFELRDYSGLRGRVTRAARDQLAKGMLATEERTIGFVGYHAPVVVRLGWKVGMKLHRARFPMNLVDNYETAIGIAVDMVKRAGYEIGGARPERSISESTWMLELDGLKGQFEFLKPEIVHLILTGAVDTIHIPFLVKKRNSLLDLRALDQVPQHLIVGLPGESDTPLVTVERLVQEIEKWCHDYPLASLTFYGADRRSQSRIHLQQNSNFTIKVVKKFETALEQVRENRSDRTISLHSFFKKKERSKVYSQADMDAYVEELLQFVGKINWEIDGCDETVMNRPDHPFRLVCDAIRLIKQDLDTLLLEKNRNEQALRESEEKYRGIFENIVDVYYRSDMEGRLILISPSGLKLLGYDREEDMIGKDIADTFYARKSDRKVLLNALKADGQVFNYEVPLKRKDGSEVIVETNSRILYDKSGNPLCIEGLIRDISERKQAEYDRKKLEMQLEHAHRLEAVGTLAGGIAHDFNNILGAIIGFAELACEDVSRDSEAYGFLREILAGGNRAKELVQQILTFSRQAEPEKRPIKTSTVLEETLRMLRASFPATIIVETNIHASSDRINANLTQIQQVLMNLCGNAVYAMGKNGGVLGIDLDTVFIDKAAASQHPDLKKGPYVRLMVRDSGHGIAPEIVGRIFDPFFSTKPPGEGTGMGLAVVHGIVKNHGGVITVNSQAKIGTTFSVFLPAVDAAPVAESTTDSTKKGGTETILLVDDETALVEVAQKILERLGYHVVPKTDSREALSTFQAEPEKFDAVITDYTMPHMTGGALAAAIKAIRPRTPVVLCTGYNGWAAENNSDAAVMAAVITKPILSAELGRVLREVLDASEKNFSKKTRILVIDDDDQFRPMVRKRLERAGYDVTEAANGREGMKLFKSVPSDLIITDLIMPEQEGLETIRAIIKEYPDTKIIAISGGGSRGIDNYLPIAKKLGAQKTYQKPLEWSALLEGVKELLG